MGTKKLIPNFPNIRKQCYEWVLICFLLLVIRRNWTFLPVSLCHHRGQTIPSSRSTGCFVSSRYTFRFTAWLGIALKGCPPNLRSFIFIPISLLPYIHYCILEPNSHPFEQEYFIYSVHYQSPFRRRNSRSSSRISRSLRHNSLIVSRFCVIRITRHFILTNY